MTMYAEERQQAIARLVTQRGRLSVNQLAREYDVTTETVRRSTMMVPRSASSRRWNDSDSYAGSMGGSCLPAPCP